MTTGNCGTCVTVTALLAQSEQEIRALEAKPRKTGQDRAAIQRASIRQEGIQAALDAINAAHATCPPPGPASCA